MAKLRSDWAFLLTMINLLGNIGILICGFIYPDCLFHWINVNNTHKYSSYNLKRNKLKIIIDSDNIYQNNTPLNSSLFLYEEQIIKPQKINIIKTYKEQPKLRKLSIDFPKFSLFDFVIIVNFLTIYFSIILIISFFIEKDECEECIDKNCYLNYYCNECCGCCACCGACCASCNLCCNRTKECLDSCCNSFSKCCNCSSQDCKCDCGDCGEGGLIILPIILAIGAIVGLSYLTYFLTKKCGKHISRNISLIIIGIINLSIICLLLLEKKESVVYVSLSISGFISISNILSIIISNYKYFQCCRYGYHSNLGTIHSETISDFKLEKEVEKNNKNDITPNDTNNNEIEDYYTIFDDNSDTPSNNNNKKGINYETNTPETDTPK